MPPAPVTTGPAGGHWRARASQGLHLAAALARRHIYVALALLAALVGLLIYGVFAESESGTGGYATAIVTRGDIQDSVTALGNLQPRDYVDVGAQVSGQLKKLDVNLGDRVKQGQLLAEIDPRVLNSKVETDKSDLANLKAQLADKQAQLALANANYDRQDRLMKADATSKSNYDAALQALRSAQAQGKSLTAQIAAAQSQLDGDEVTLGYTKIYAPMDGTVVSITAKQGQTLNANQQAPTILRVADLSIMTVWTQVSEADVPKLRLGMPAYFTTLGEPDKRWTGTLTQIQPTPDVVNNVVLYTATFDVKNPDDRLMTQMTAQVFFVTASATNVLTVPVAALHQREAKTSATKTGPQYKDTPATPLPPGAKRYWVQIVKPDGTIAPRAVVIGVSNRVTAQVISGLRRDEKVVVGSASNPPANGAANQPGVSRMRGFGGLH
ncbi:MAG: efflux RND transporter periplasmic adaptor subunit [Alphaproteobacteria bacterium]|nr:efflux RND transporter periplasmic adaptor subunit [Alphaproteobacteria bacterium]